MTSDLPAPLFKQFERVRLVGDRPQVANYLGERGTVIWLDSYYVRQQPGRADRWMYVVHLTGRGCWRTFLQSDLESERTFDAEAMHLSDRPEISFDTVLEADNDYTEGSFRLPDGFWQVVVFRKDEVQVVSSTPSIWERPTAWELEATGLVIRMPRGDKVDREYLLRVMYQVIGFDGWVEVSGPDSMNLR
jgi:hypothetical protein